MSLWDPYGSTTWDPVKKIEEQDRDRAGRREGWSIPAVGSEDGKNKSNREAVLRLDGLLLAERRRKVCLPSLLGGRAFSSTPSVGWSEGEVGVPRGERSASSNTTAPEKKQEALKATTQLSDMYYRKI